ncbi:hypothetical protein [Candidatus Magnetominusculus dajiuhuensis]|uniref:hypothetical protein n=1 Tax=Candidatus Magnetominusculus dajiuhuensis TaxID=3137712 RepID=UPI003B42D42D
MLSNFMLKVEDSKLPDVQKALKAAGVKVKSIVELYKEGAAEDKSEDKPDA